MMNLVLCEGCSAFSLMSHFGKGVKVKNRYFLIEDVISDIDSFNNYINKEFSSYFAETLYSRTLSELKSIKEVPHVDFLVSLAKHLQNIYKGGTL